MKWMLLLLSLMMLVGCSSAPKEMSREDRAKVGREIAEKFGKALQAGDFDAAYAMTSAEYHLRVNSAKFKMDFQEALGKGKIEGIETDSGSLPSNVEQARSDYGIPASVEQKTWVSWAFTIFRAGMSSFEARILVVDDGGQMKIGSIQYGMVS